MNRVAALLVACGLAIASAACVVPYSGAARPIAASSVVAADGWTVAAAPEVRQTGLADCGPAALAMIAARWEVALSRDAITAELAPLATHGVRLGALRQVARTHGLRAFAVPGDQALLVHELAQGRPVLVGLIRPHGAQAASHFEVVVAVHADGRIATIDPGAGWQVRPWAAFDAEWAAAARPALVVLAPRR